jgi:uncharacterized phage-associated protein
MSYSSIAIANSFLGLVSDSTVQVPPMTNMKIQKLVYIAHGFTLGMLHEPLLSTHVHAFQYGPVMPVLYEKLKKFGSGPVPGLINVDSEVTPLNANDYTVIHASIIRGVWNKYGKLSAIQLSNITHKEGTPWDVTWKATPFGIIRNDLIESHYMGLLQKA